VRRDVRILARFGVVRSRSLCDALAVARASQMTREGWAKTFRTKKAAEKAAKGKKD